jgi:NitT/TauT family transport system ATP-binding protein
MLPDTAIELEGVEKRFDGGTLALAGVSLRVPRRGFVAIVGPSGCGKSTLLRIVAGLEPATAGTVRVAPPDASRAQVQRLSFVFQDATLMPWADVFDNVWLPLRVAGSARAQARERIAPVLEAVGLSAFERAYPRELSGGMRMRVSIARALVSRPAMLLMDEPFAALDEITRMRLNDDLLDWWRARDLTALFVTHSVFEAVYLSERVIVMGPRPGRFVADIEVDEPYPRGEAFRTSQRYAARCAQVSRALRAAMEDAA